MFSWLYYDVDEMPEVRLYDVEELVDLLYDKASKPGRDFFTRHEDAFVKYATREYNSGDACFDKDEETREVREWASGTVDEAMKQTLQGMKEAEAMNEYTTEEAELFEVLGLH